MKQKIIDMQAHFMPESYISCMRHRKEIPYIESQGNLYRFRYGESESSTYWIKPSFYDISLVLESMDAAGIDMQVLSINIPGAEVGEHDLSIAIAQKANDDYADIVSRYPERFTAFATLPLSDTDAALREAERAIGQLGFTGVMFFSNIYGMHLSDRKLWPIYAFLEQQDIPMYIHPTKPLVAPFVEDYGLEAMVGYLYDTSLAALKMILSGVFETYPNLKVIMPHAGGVLPYLAKRLDHQAQLNPQANEHITMPPSEYLKKLYLDTVCLSTPSLQLACDLVGADHILFATDYPFVPIQVSLDVVDGLRVGEQERELIYCGNAQKLLKLA